MLKLKEKFSKKNTPSGNKSSHPVDLTQKYPLEVWRPRGIFWKRANLVNIYHISLENATKSLFPLLSRNFCLVLLLKSKIKHNELHPPSIS